MKLNDYYTQELYNLRTLGKEFSLRNPSLSSFLAEKGQDPDVERLLEGFAFLTGKLREKMDGEFPELTHGLTQLMWANYLQPIPSYTIVAFTPEKSKVEKTIVPKNTQLNSFSQRAQTACPFFSNYEVELHPIVLKEVNYFINGYTSTIELEIELTSGALLSDLELAYLRFYLGGSEFVSQELQLFLQRYVSKIDISVPTDNKHQTLFSLEANAISSVGFDEEQNILPRHQNVFKGYVLMQEYFCYREKFNFIDINGFKQFRAVKPEILEKHNAFRVSIHFDRHLSIADDLHLETLDSSVLLLLILLRPKLYPYEKSIKMKSMRLFLLS